jgi:hypothetical protein
VLSSRSGTGKALGIDIFTTRLEEL